MESPEIRLSIHRLTLRRISPSMTRPYTYSSDSLICRYGSIGQYASEAYDYDEAGNMIASYSQLHVTEAQLLADIFRDDYNQHRPHSSLGGIPPAWYRERLTQRDTQLS